MEPVLSPEDLATAAMKAELRARGWYVRTTEWPSGHQVVLHARSDISRALVTEWEPTELEAFRSAFRLADEAQGLTACAVPPLD